MQAVNFSECSEKSKELQVLIQCREKLVTALTFNMSWVAGELNKEGLLSHIEYDKITTPNTWLNEKDKSLMMVKSLMKKVELEPKSLNIFIKILKNDFNQYREAILILEETPAANTSMGSNTSLCPAVITPVTSVTTCSTASYISQVTSEITTPYTLEPSSSQDSGPPHKRMKLDDSALNNTLENGGSLEFNITLKSREYQLELAEPGLQGKNYIFVAPTGSGKP